jgi:hypothetical protein
MLVFWAFRGRVATLQALELSVLVKYMNPGLVSYSSLSGVLLWLVILAAAIRVYTDATTAQWRRSAPAFVFVSIALLLSIAVSPAVEISVMKLMTFGLVVSTVLMATTGLNDAEAHSLQRWLLTLGLTVIALSALTLLRPGVAFLLNGTGLQGILNHPQSLGTFAAPYSALLLSQALLLRQGRSSARFVAIALCWTVMFMTEARTAAFAATFGVLAAGAARLWWGRKRRSETSPGAVLAAGAAALLVLAGAALAFDRVGTAVESFLLKRSGEQDVAAAFNVSRGVGAAAQWQNFLDSPLAGHGFGVYPDGSFPNGVTRVWGIPISAPVEKGFVPSAVLEETGVPGAIAFAVMIACLWGGAVRSRDPVRIAVFVAALGVNVGEAVILSPGGIGLHVWIILALASSPAGLRIPVAQAAVPVADRVALRRFPQVMR